MNARKAGDTRERLLEAASDLFAEKGYGATTVAEICGRAESNIAAVNYYFGSKEALYQESWRHCFEESLDRHPQHGGVAPNAPVEERLEGQVRALLARVSDPDNRDFFIAQREFLQPTGLLDAVMEQEFIPQRKRTLALVRELLGPEASESQVVFCEASLIGMCLHPMVLQRARLRNGNPELPLMIEDITAYADHVVRFALAGIAAVRAQDASTGAAPGAGE